ncbi:hypothetical protein [Robertmurraya siralis]|nr:hypothetical protein [Robertmurraya siralis]
MNKYRAIYYNGLENGEEIIEAVDAQQASSIAFKKYGIRLMRIL